jgi:DNA invertase Pin-like site-specific DNA recombinase
MLIDGYIRVSQVRGRSGASFISPAVQRERIESWARLQGAVLGEVFEELDESGARKDRPLLIEALRRVESGESQGLVVARLDRFGRSLTDSLAAIERIQAAGGTFASVGDGLDLSTDTGKLVLRIMLSMAEWELDRIRSQWDVARERAVARGVHLGSRRPSGYAWMEEHAARSARQPTTGVEDSALAQQRAFDAGAAERRAARARDPSRVTLLRVARGGVG